MQATQVVVPFVQDIFIMDGSISFMIEDYDPKTHVVYVESKYNPVSLVVTPDMDGYVEEAYDIPNGVPGGKGEITVVAVEAGTNTHLARYPFTF